MFPQTTGGRVFTHFGLDLDNSFSVAWWREFRDPHAEIVFVAADWNGGPETVNRAGETVKIPAFRPGIDVALDLDLNGFGIKGDKIRGEEYCCFATLVLQQSSTADQQALASLMSFVNAQDNKGSAYKHFAPGMPEHAEQIIRDTGINAVLRALQSACEGDEREVLRMMQVVFRGLLLNGRARWKAEKDADEAEVMEYRGRKAAIARNARIGATNQLLYQRGMDAVVYVDHHNLGAVLNSQRRQELSLDHPRIRRLAEKAGESWYFDPRGFIAAWGTRKAPKQSSSKVDPQELAREVLKVLAEAE